MRGPSIQKTAAVSVLLHLTILVLSVVIINYSKNVVMPSPYTVSLVSSSRGRSSGESVQKAEEPKSTAVEKAKSPEESKEVTKTDKKADEKVFNERMSALEAIAKLKRNKELRKKMAAISVKGSGAKSGVRSSEKAEPAGGPKGTAEDIYRAKITEEIQSEWIYPEYMKKDHQAVVSVTIRKDGTLLDPKIEKKSGDLFFDNSVLKAVIKASPVTPPPSGMEMEILEIRFSL
jgi:colicin import membrane protein